MFVGYLAIEVSLAVRPSLTLADSINGLCSGLRLGGTSQVNKRRSDSNTRPVGTQMRSKVTMIEMAAILAIPDTPMAPPCPNPYFI